MRYRLLKRIQNVVIVTCVVAFLGIGVILAQRSGLVSSELTSSLAEMAFGDILTIGSKSTSRGQIALISGHAGFDSGAVCYDDSGALLYTEAEVNQAIVEETSLQLRRHRLEVVVLEEYDARLRNLDTTLLLSLHSDSCIEQSGYKGARHPNSPVAHIEEQFLVCLDRHYATATGLPHHPNTLTHDMFEYHAFNKVAPQTPAIILEMGFMGGDGDLLLNRPRVVASAIADSILCYLDYLEDREPSPEREG